MSYRMGTLRKESAGLGRVSRIILVTTLSLPIGCLLWFILIGFGTNSDHPSLDKLFFDIYTLLWFVLLVPVPFIIPLVGTLLELILRPFKPELRRRIIIGSWLLMGMLMLTELFFTTLWSRWVYGNLYVHFDYVPLFDCTPFFLLIDHGSCLQYFHGMTEGSIYTLWTVYALLCWCTAIAITYLLMKRNARDIAVAKTPESLLHSADSTPKSSE
jgi:hypothetical protein